MILEGPSLCITEDKTKGKVAFENCRLISINTVQLFSEAGWVDGLGGNCTSLLNDSGC